MVEDSSKEQPAQADEEPESLAEHPIGDAATTTQAPSSKTLEDLRSRALQTLGTKRKASSKPEEEQTSKKREDGELTDEEGEISDPALSDISENSLVDGGWVADEHPLTGSDYLVHPSHHPIPYGATASSLSTGGAVPPMGMGMHSHPHPHPPTPIIPPFGHIPPQVPLSSTRGYVHAPSQMRPPNPMWYAPMHSQPPNFPPVGLSLHDQIRPWGDHPSMGHGPPGVPVHQHQRPPMHEGVSRSPSMPFPMNQLGMRPSLGGAFRGRSAASLPMPSLEPRESTVAVSTFTNQPEDKDKCTHADGDVIMDETDLVVESVEDMNHMHPTTPSKGPAQSSRALDQASFWLDGGGKKHQAFDAIGDEPKTLRRTQSSPPAKLSGSPVPIAKVTSFVPPRPAFTKPPIQTKLTIVYGEDDSSDDESDEEPCGVEGARPSALEKTIMEMKATLEKAEAKKKRVSGGPLPTKSAGPNTPPLVKKSTNTTQEELKVLRKKLAEMEKKVEQKKKELDGGAGHKRVVVPDAFSSRTQKKPESEGMRKRKAADFMDDDKEVVIDPSSEGPEAPTVPSELAEIKGLVKTLQEQLNKDRISISEVQELISKSQKSREMHMSQVQVLTSRRNALRASLDSAERKLQDSEALAAEQAKISSLLEKRLVELKAVHKKSSLELEKQLALAAATAKEARIGLLHHGNKGLLEGQEAPAVINPSNVENDDGIDTEERLAQELNMQFADREQTQPLIRDDSRLASLGVYDFSPLKMLKCYRLSPLFYSLWRLNSDSVTFSNHIDPQKELCRFELHGSCNDECCSKQHERDYRMTEIDIIQDICRYWTGGAPERTLNSVQEAIEWVQSNIRDSKLSSFLQLSRTESQQTKSSISMKKSKGKGKKMPKSQKKMKAGTSKLSPAKNPSLNVSGPPQQTEDEIVRNDAFVPMYEITSDLRSIEEEASINNDRYYSQKTSSAFEHFETVISGLDSNVNVFLEYIAALESDNTVEKEVIVNILVRGIEKHPDSEQLWLMYLPRYQSIVSPTEFAKMCSSARQRLGPGCMPLLRLWLGTYKSVQDIDLVYSDIFKQEVADLVRLGDSQGASDVDLRRERLELCLTELVLWRAHHLERIEVTHDNESSGNQSFNWLCEVMGIHTDAKSGLLSEPLVPSILKGERSLLLFYSICHCAATGSVPSLDLAFGVVQHGHTLEYNGSGKASSRLKRLHMVENHFKPRALHLDGLESGLVAVTAAIIEMELSVGAAEKSIKHVRSLSSRYMGLYESGPRKCPLMWLKIAKAEDVAMKPDNVFKAFERAIESCSERKWWLMYHHYCTATRGVSQDNSGAVALLLGASPSSDTLTDDIVAFCASCESALGRGPLTEDLIDLDFDADMIGNYAVLLHALSTSERFRDIPLKHFDYVGVFEYALSLTGSKSKGRILWERYLSLVHGMEALPLLARAVRDSTGYCPGDKVLDEDWWFDNLVNEHIKGLPPQRRYELCLRLSKILLVQSKAVHVLLLESALEIGDSSAVEKHLSEARRFFMLPSLVWQKVILWSRAVSKEGTIQHFKNAVQDNLYDLSLWNEFVLFVIQEAARDGFAIIAEELRVELQDLKLSDRLVSTLDETFASRVAPSGKENSP